MRVTTIPLLLGLLLVSVRARAEACTMASECTSGFCVDGVCCDTACTGTCQACSAAKKGTGADGTCGNAAAGTSCGGVSCTAGEISTPACDSAGTCATVKTPCGLFACSGAACATSCAADADCSSVAWCDAGLCIAKLANGVAATDKRACTSGFLADGVCCNVACDGVCEACDLEGSKGTCVPVVGAPKHGTCPMGTDVCGNASCDGVTRNECKKLPGAEKECRASMCEGGVETLSARCDGMGACPAATTKACNEYVCDGTKCRTTCRSSPDCATGFVCDEIDKKCLPANTCDGDHTVTGRNGEKKDCTPYKCDKTECLSACVATSQCTAGFTCNGKECVRTTDVPLDSSDDDGGCAIVGAPGRTSALSLALLGVALAALGRARKRC